MLTEQVLAYFAPKHGQRESLRDALVRAVVIVLVITIICGGLLTYWQALRKIETEVSSALTLAEKTARKWLPEIERDENPRLELLRLVRLFQGNRHVRATFFEPGPPQIVTASEAAQVERFPDWFLYLLDREKEVIKVALPPSLASLGTLQLETDITSEVAEVWDEVVLKLAILIVFCTVLSALVFSVIGQALRPIKSLLVAFEELGSGRYGVRVVNTQGTAELMALCDGFNAMSERLGEMERRNHVLNEQLATVQDEERADLARDLHDEVSPFLFSVEVDAGAIRRIAHEGNAPEFLPHADHIREAVAHMKKHVRSVLIRLRPSVHLELGLEGAIESLVCSWRKRYPRVAFTISVTDIGFGQRLDLLIHNLVREGISNALKHAKPNSVEIVVVRMDDGSARVEIADDGQGADVVRTGAGFGLISMRERILAQGGTMAAGNRTDAAGFEIIAVIPQDHAAGKSELGLQGEG